MLGGALAWLSWLCWKLQYILVPLAVITVVGALSETRRGLQTRSKKTGEGGTAVETRSSDAALGKPAPGSAGDGSGTADGWADAPGIVLHIVVQVG